MNLLKERWVSGLNHRFAKPAKEATPSEGSNPSLSAIFIGFEAILYAKNVNNAFFYQK